MFFPSLLLLLIFSHQLTLSECQFLDIDIITRPQIMKLIELLMSVLEKLPTSECKDHFQHLGNALARGETWALKMLDATAKPQSGILLGNMMHVGNYDECLEIDVRVDKNQIRGKYCTAFFEAHPTYGAELSKLINDIWGDISENNKENEVANKARLSYGFCVPKVCTAANLQNITDLLENMAKSPFHFSFDDRFCDGGDGREFSGWTIFAIAVFSIFAFLLVFGTMYDFLVYRKLSDTEKHPNLLVAFSVMTNGKKLMSSKTAEGNLNCLNGLRVISMMWIVLSHSFQDSFYVPHVNAQHMLDWKNYTENAIIVAPVVAVDTFFVISGLLVVYLYMKSQAKGVKFSLPMFYLHRILRLTPALAMAALFTATLLNHMGSGPFWPIVEDMFQKPCVKNWWSTLIYLQNYITPEEQCLPQAWYLAVDTQMYFLSPLIFWPLIKWPKQTIGAIVVFVVLICGYVFGMTWMKHLGTNFMNQNLEHYKYIYSPTHVRCTVYLIGMVCGYFIYKTKTTSALKLDKVKTNTLWLLSLTIMITIVLGHGLMMRAPEYNVLDSSFFNSLIRVGWALALSVIIILCVSGYGGPINSFLSCTLFNILIRLNYSVYIVHLNIIIIVMAQGRTPTYFSDLVGFHYFWGDYMFSLGTALMWTLAFESPVIIIEKIIFNTRRSSKLTHDSPNNLDGEKSISVQIVNNLNNNATLVKS